jgi:hypothetical protein
MGLDIHASSKVVKANNADEANYFIRRGPNHVDQAQDLQVGEYSESPESRSHGFRAGSYSGYNQFRRGISQIILGKMPEEIWGNETSYMGKPFFELINFSDCEGHFGPLVSKKLHKDFVDNRDKYIAEIAPLNPYPGYYEKVYDDFMLGFEIASDEGILQFC